MSSEDAPASPEEGRAGLHRRLARTLSFPFRLPGRLRDLSSALQEHSERIGLHLDGLGARLDHVEGSLSDLGGDLEAARSELSAGLQTSEMRLDRVDETLRAIQGEIENLRDIRAAAMENRLDATEDRLRHASEEVSCLRDVVLPAVVERGNVLVDRLAEELEEQASLVARMLASEPLPAPTSTADAARLADGLERVQARVLEAFRGSEEEIKHRLDRYLGPLRECAPVLDLGCGRGELLTLLREAAVDATGVDSDPALVEAARRRGLRVLEGDAVAVLGEQHDASWGAVTALHIFEHLPPATLLQALREIRRVLRPQGLLVAECPNPHSLRVGASLYWRDPTHQHPLLPETLSLFLEASGFEVEEVALLHPFPAEQRFAGQGGAPPENEIPEVVALHDRIDRLDQRLDELLNGARDYAILARTPAGRIG